MFQQKKSRSGIMSLIRFSDLLFHTTVRVVRKSNSNAVMGLIMNILQSALLIVVFYGMLSIFGMRRNAVRGDYLVFLMTGVFLFITHTKTVGAVFNSEGPASAIMKHAPMTTFLSIASSALASLYLQLLSMAVILFVVHVTMHPVVIYDPAGVMLSFFLAWFTGVTIGLMFLALKPFFPNFSKTAAMVYARANMIGSGKMFAANHLPGYLLPYFSWNPLFHTIDQARGAAFINYSPHVTSIMYPVYFSLVLLIIGMMGEFFTRQYASASWNSRR